MKKRFIVVHGPTGVGKSDVITSLGKSFSIEIINCDVGQFYEPFSIGTAKPDWKNELIPHHLFDLIKEPEDFSVTRYREIILKTKEQIWERGNIPVLVGGSGFYGKSLFFPPQGNGAQQEETKEGSWQDLHLLDPQRAAQIHQNDTYRIGRALSMLHESNCKPSDCKPQFDRPEGDCLIIFLNRETEELYQRINKRTKKMLDQGWIEEVEKIVGTKWETFLERKKLIGYTNILQYLKKAAKSNDEKENLKIIIAQKTRNYAKRQKTFWRMFKKLLEPYFNNTESGLIEVNLTLDPNGSQLSQHLKKFLS